MCVLQPSLSLFFFFFSRTFYNSCYIILYLFTYILLHSLRQYFVYISHLFLALTCPSPPPPPFSCTISAQCCKSCPNEKPDEARRANGDITCSLCWCLGMWPLMPKRLDYKAFPDACTLAWYSWQSKRKDMHL